MCHRAVPAEISNGLIYLDFEREALLVDKYFDSDVEALLQELSAFGIVAARKLDDLVCRLLCYLLGGHVVKRKDSRKRPTVLLTAQVSSLRPV